MRVSETTVHIGSKLSVQVGLGLANLEQRVETNIHGVYQGSFHAIIRCARNS